VREGENRRSEYGSERWFAVRRDGVEVLSDGSSLSPHNQTSMGPRRSSAESHNNKAAASYSDSASMGRRTIVRGNRRDSRLRSRSDRYFNGAADKQFVTRAAYPRDRSLTTGYHPQLPPEDMRHKADQRWPKVRTFPSSRWPAVAGDGGSFSG
jgi:hypothetical protein